MPPGIEKRRVLGRELKVMFAKYGIKQNEIACEMGITRQYICQICSGKSPLSPEYFEKIYDALIARDASENDLLVIFRAYLDSKLQIPYKNLLENLKDIEVILLKKFRKLPVDEKDQVIVYMEKLQERIQNKKS